MRGRRIAGAIRLVRREISRNDADGHTLFCRAVTCLATRRQDLICEGIFKSCVCLTLEGQRFVSVISRRVMSLISTSSMPTFSAFFVQHLGGFRISAQGGVVVSTDSAALYTRTLSKIPLFCNDAIRRSHPKRSEFRLNLPRITKCGDARGIVALFPLLDSLVFLLSFRHGLKY